MSIFSTLAEKSWLTPSAVDDVQERGMGPAAKTALSMFMATLTSMFLLFAVGYRMRMAQPDWQPIDDPSLLWFNTALLVFAGLLMQAAKNAATGSHIKGVRNYLSMAGVLTLAFLVGQSAAWGELRDSGLYDPRNPAAAFFILLTGVHALHLVGGLLVWARATWRAWQGIEVKRIRLSVELCTVYWHFLLLVWLVFFTLLLLT